MGNEERERDSSLLSHMVGEYEETAITGYLLDLALLFYDATLHTQEKSFSPTRINK